MNLLLQLQNHSIEGRDLPCISYGRGRSRHTGHGSACKRAGCIGRRSGRVSARVRGRVGPGAIAVALRRNNGPAAASASAWTASATTAVHLTSGGTRVHCTGGW